MTIERMTRLSTQVFGPVCISALLFVAQSATAKKHTGRAVIPAQTPAATRGAEKPAVATPQQTIATGMAGMDENLTQTAVLLGERVEWAIGARHQPAPADVLSTASSILGMKVLDLTISGEKLDDTAKRIDAVASMRPTVVILFTGQADEKAHSTEDSLRPALLSLSGVMMRAGARVFVAPSSTSLAADTMGTLRFVTQSANVEFVDLGTQIKGKPVEEALHKISKKLNSPVERPGAVQLATPAAEPRFTSGQVTSGSTASGSVTNAAGQSPIMGSMPMPAPLKNFDPTEHNPYKQKPGETKKPAVAR